MNSNNKKKLTSGRRKPKNSLVDVKTRREFYVMIKIIKQTLIWIFCVSRGVFKFFQVFACKKMQFYLLFVTWCYSFSMAFRVDYLSFGRMMGGFDDVIWNEQNSWRLCWLNVGKKGEEWNTKLMKVCFPVFQSSPFSPTTISNGIFQNLRLSDNFAFQKLFQVHI